MGASSLSTTPNTAATCNQKQRGTVGKYVQHMQFMEVNHSKSVHARRKYSEAGLLFNCVQLLLRYVHHLRVGGARVGKQAKQVRQAKRVRGQQA